MLSVYVFLRFLWGGTAAYKHQQKVKAEQQRVEMEKKALEEAKKKEKKLEEETRKAVDNLFADKEKHFLNDSYMTETLQQVKNVVSRVKNEKLKKEWNETLKKAEECYQQIEQSKQSMAALFKNEEKSELADDVTREMIDALKKQVEENTPQKAAQESLQKDMETAYQLMEQKEEAQKEQERKEQEQKEKEEKEQEAREREQQARNAAPSVSGSENSSANGNSNPASDSNSNNPSGSAQTQPIVASMNLANQTNQIITVVASGTSAQVTFWQKSNTGWGQVFSTYGQVGSQGVGPADEYHSYTPRGAYSLGFAFGTNNPGTSFELSADNKSFLLDFQCGRPEL